MFRLIGRTLKGNHPIKQIVTPHHYAVQQRLVNTIGSDSAAYAGDGKTTVRVINKSDYNLNFVNTYSSHGFRLQNNMFIYGSIILFPTHVFSWNVRRGKEINTDSLLLFDLIVPKVKIVIIGYGEVGEEHDETLAIKLKKKGISCEVLATPNAVTTYNYLVADSVHVAGAFVPVRHEVAMTDKDVVEIATDQQKFETKISLPQTFVSREPMDYDRKLAKKTVLRDRDKDDKVY